MICLALKAEVLGRWQLLAIIARRFNTTLLGEGVYGRCVVLSPTEKNRRIVLGHRMIRIALGRYSSNQK